MSVISPSEAAEDRRFNAVKQNFTGAHLILDDSQRERYNAVLDRFTRAMHPCDLPHEGGSALNHLGTP